MNVNINEQLAKVALNKSLLKEYSNSSNERIVYLENNTEFQIQIYNPYDYPIGVEFSFNGSSSDGHYLYVRPGQRIWLDRYLNNEQKLLFTTYEVNDTKSNQYAIRNNGEITVKFYKEKQQTQTYFINSITTYPSNGIKLFNNEITCDNAINYCNCDSLSLGVSSASTATTACYDAKLTASAQTKGISRSLSTKLSDNIETGRIERGSHSNQKLTSINAEFEYWAFKTEVIKLLPLSRKPITSNDLSKKYCSNCGRKLNQKYKFCPYCGAKVEFCPNIKKGNYEIVSCPNCNRNVRSNMMECPHCGEILN